MINIIICATSKDKLCGPNTANFVNKILQWCTFINTSIHIKIIKGLGYMTHLVICFN